MLKDAGDGQESEDDKEKDKVDQNSQFTAHDKEYTFSPKSLYIFSNTNSFRLKVINMITHKNFDNLILVIIVSNSICLAMMDYEDENAFINKQIEHANTFFSVAFGLECIFKVIGMGFVLDKGSYLRDPWNWLDFTVVVSSLLT